MAMPSTPSSCGDLEEKINHFKLMRLIIDLGTEALRNEFNKIHKGNLQTVLGTHKPTLGRLKSKKIITQPQWEKLYPSMTSIPNTKEFDITLMVILLTNICGIPAPVGTAWGKMPLDSDPSLSANVVRVRLFRNEFFGHIPETGVTATEFEDRWKDVSTTLVNLGIHQADIDRLRDEECGEEEVDRIRRECSENDTEVALQLLELRKLLLEIQESLSNDLSISKCLVRCNFDTDIELISQKWCKGTREWVFDEISKWFSDTTSDSRAFIITGQAGMGKSVIAAVICKRYAKRLAASHFCQYNNDRYNNPKILLQSLAAQLSDVIPEYRKALVEKVSGKEGKRLDDMNIQALFSLLFKEPLAGVQVAEKHLIVIDAVDECQHEGRSDLINLIANYLCHLPNFIRFLITSRPENDIAKKFEKLKPMSLSRNNEQNRKDLQLYFQSKLCDPNLADYIGKLLEKCDGLMLFADCLYQILKDCSSQYVLDNLPTGIEEIYESYFKRLKSELEILLKEQNRKVVFLKFLRVIAVAKQPLPIAILYRILTSDNDSHAILRTIKNSLSSLLAVDEERISFFHKSVKDWLVESDHDFTVNEKLGHETLAEICAQEMDEMKLNRIEPPFQPATEYALLYGIQHKLSGTQAKPLESFIDKYVIDLEIMHASVTVDVDATLNNFSSLKKDTNYNTSSVPEQKRKNFEELMSLIRKYINILRYLPQSFLQHVLNWGEDELSLKAKSLLKSRYKDLVYFELIEKESVELALIGRIYTRRTVVAWDFLPSENYVVCSFADNTIELFSLSDFKSLWTIKDVKITFSATAYNSKHLYRPLVFHPGRGVILPGRLDRVINLQGVFESGPFLNEKKKSYFSNCCFSNDGTKFVTIWEKQLTVWDLENNKELASFSTDENLISISFSANDKFLACSGENGKVAIYDCEKHFLCIKSNTFDNLTIFVCSFESESWYIVRSSCWKMPLFKISADLSEPHLVRSSCRYLPLNVKAVNELKILMENRQESWLNHFDGVWFFSLDSGPALVFNFLDSDALELLNISKLQGTPEFSFIAESDLKGVDMSVDGKFLYLKTTSSVLIHTLDESYQRITSPADHKKPLVQFTPIINGMIITQPPGHERCSHPTIPELWNSDMTKSLDTFPEVSGTYKCESISEQVIACFKEQMFCFFNFVTKKIVSTTSFNEDTGVIAYSSKYHVVLQEPFVKLSLRQNGKVVDKWSSILNKIRKTDVKKAIIFSPSGDKLTLLVNDNHFLVYEVATAELLHKIDIKSLFSLTNFSCFLDEDYLLCYVKNQLEFIVNITYKSGNPLTCTDFHEPISFSCMSRKHDDGFVLVCNANESGKIKLTKLWLPR